MFAITSRYYGIDVAQSVTPEGKTIRYVRRRFIPPPENFVLVQEHAVMDGERLDHIANTYLGDPEQFWRICDPNNVLDPEDLTATPGQRIRITLPEGIAGVPNSLGS